MTFRVDGVSRSDCYEMAKKKTPVTERGVNLSEKDWLAKVDEVAARCFASCKPRILKHFATPELMMDFFRLALAKPDEIRSLRLMELYDTGAKDPVTKDPICKWREYGSS